MPVSRNPLRYRNSAGSISTPPNIAIPLVIRSAYGSSGATGYEAVSINIPGARPRRLRIIGSLRMIPRLCQSALFLHTLEGAHSVIYRITVLTQDGGIWGG